MALTYVLVDFENVQPQDMDLLRGDDVRVCLFHGPNQNKLDMSLVRALQPLGANVDYLQSGKSGKNALDFHMAFHIGRLVQEHLAHGMHGSKSPRFILISKDGGFDSLLSHLCSLGFEAVRAATIRDVLVAAYSYDEPQCPPGGLEAAPAQTPGPAAATGVPSDQGLPAKSKLKGKLPMPQSGSGPPTPSSKPTETRPAKPASPKPPASGVIDKVIENLRTHANNRPRKRDALERHVATLLGNKAAAASAPAVVEALQAMGIATFDDKAVKYTIPKRNK